MDRNTLRDELTSKKSKLTDNARVVLAKRYLKKDEKGDATETPEEMFFRVAENIASIENSYGSDPEKWTRVFYDLMANLEFLPNSPTLMNAGRDLQQLSACFVLSIGDSMEEIFDAVKYTALVHKSGGGTGFTFSNLRPSGDRVKSTMGVSSGPVSFMRVFDIATETVKQAGLRRGANMGLLMCHHPDILDFISVKEKDGILSNFNISVGITKEFMEALDKGEEYSLINPRSKQVARTIGAKEVFDKIVDSAWRNGEPGVIFMDEMNAHNPTPHIGAIEATNPCLHGDSFLLTKKGLIKIKNLVNTDTQIWNGSNWVSSKIVCTGIKPVYGMKMSNGMFLKGTEDHKINTPVGGTLLGQSIGKEINRVMGSDWEGIPIELSDEELLGLGFAFGDSNFHKASGRYKYLYIGNNDKEIETLFNSLGESLEVSGRCDKRLISAFFAKKCDLLEFPQLPLPDRFLSDRILQLPPKQLKIFLKGLFSANGSIVGEQRVTLKSACNELVSQVQVLLMALGMKSYITTNKAHDVKFSNGIYGCKKSYDLNITSDDLHVFRVSIGFVQMYKMDRLNAICLRDFGRRISPKVVSVEYIGEDYVYDFTEPETHWAFVNGLQTHNCGEQPLLTNESCVLGSINLLGMLVDSKIDFKKLSDTTHTAVRFLDNVIDMNKYPLPEIGLMTKSNRKIGLGVMGFSDMLIKLGIPYNSPEAATTAESVMKFIHDEGHKASIDLAKERGPFPNFKGSIYDKGPEIRNATVTTIAPTGTLSMIASCSSGVEPLFALVYEKNVMDNKKFLEVHPEFLRVAKKEGFYSEDLIKTVHKVGSIKDIDSVPEDIKKTFVTAHDITPIDHISIQAAFQKYTDNAVSKTVNFRHDATKKDVEDVYRYAYKMGCKGVTVYRDGSRSNQVLTVGSSEETKGTVSAKDFENGTILAKDIKLPMIFDNGPTHIIKREGKKFYLHFSFLPDDTKKKYPICIWIQTNHKYAASELRVCNRAAQNLQKLAQVSGINKRFIKETLEKANQDYPHNRLGRMISLCLRHGVKREDILVALMNIEGDHVSTLLTAVRKFLSKTLENGTILKSLKCPDCESKIKMENGCMTCEDPTCGWSAC